jgi:hypothetical protein
MDIRTEQTPASAESYERFTEVIPLHTDIIRATKPNDWTKSRSLDKKAVGGARNSTHLPGKPPPAVTYERTM